MALLDQTTAITKEKYIGPVVNTMEFESKTFQAFMRAKRIETGPAGNGLRIVPRHKRRISKHYRRWDTLQKATVEDKLAYFVDWYNMATLAGVDGETLRRNTGLTVEQVEMMDSVSQMSDEAELRYVNALVSELEAASDDHFFNWIVAMHTKQTQGVESFQELFNLSINFQGLARNALGTFPTDDPWFTNYPGGPTHTTANINAPVIFDNSGTLRTISPDILDQPTRRMRRYRGPKIMPLHPNLMSTLSKSFLPQIQLRPSTNSLMLGVDTITYNGCEIFEDEFAPTDRARIFNLRHYFPICWNPDDTNVNRQIVRNQETMQSVWFGKWRVADNQDGIAGYFHSMYTLYCDEPSAQAEIRDLQA